MLFPTVRVPSDTRNVFVAVFNATVLFAGMKPSVIVDVGGAEVGKAECKAESVVLDIGTIVSLENVKPFEIEDVGGTKVGMAGAIVSSREVSDAFRFAPNVFVFQCGSIPKRGPESDDGALKEIIPEKSNGSDGLNDIDMPVSPPQLYEAKPDVEFRNCVIGESALGGCSDPLCDMAGS